MGLSFTHESLPQRVVFGAGGARRHLAAEIDRLGAARVMLVASAAEDALADRIAGDLPVVYRWSEVHPHVPVEVARRARRAAIDAEADALVSIGGGSAVGLAKAVAMTTGLPIVAVPTTYAGSEATNVWGLTEKGVKTTGADNAVLPASVIYDSELTVGLPVDLSVASGLNALAHCIDSLWAPRADPINAALCLEGARALATGLPEVVADPGGIDGRDRCLYGAYLAAVGFASAGAGMHHQICHVLGGAYGLPHAQTHAVVLPYVLAFNAASLPTLGRRLAVALGSPTPTDPDAASAALDELRRRSNAPTSLAELGMREADLPDAVRRCLAAVPDTNPTPVTPRNLTELLYAAWSGRQTRRTP